MLAYPSVVLVPIAHTMCIASHALCMCVRTPCACHRRVHRMRAVAAWGALGGNMLWERRWGDGGDFGETLGETLGDFGRDFGRDFGLGSPGDFRFRRALRKKKKRVEREFGF
jgi:hypothetical protein